MPDWFWYVLAPVGVVGYLCFYLWTRRKAATGIAASARRRGWDYEKADRSLAGLHSGWPFSGNGRCAFNVLSGYRRDRSFVAFEFSIRIGIESKYADDGLFRNRCRYQVVSVAHGRSSLPVLTVETHDPVAADTAAALKGDGSRVGHTEFDRTFSVSMRDSSPAREIFTDDCCAWFLAHPSSLASPLRFEAGRVTTWRSGAMNVDELDELLDYLNGVIDRLPVS